MTHIEYFKLQAKNLFRDYKTKTSHVDEADGNSYYKYDPKYFDVDAIFVDYDWDEEAFSLMNANTPLLSWLDSVNGPIYRKLLKSG